jgi:hypothetical protein
MTRKNMKQLFVLMVCALVLAGCAKTKRTPMPVWTPVAAAPEPVLTDVNGQPIERIPFRAGVSTVTVENLLKKQGCVGGTGAGLTTPPGPVEVYRMVCEDKRVLMAKCEMRQCKPM